MPFRPPDLRIDCQRVELDSAQLQRLAEASAARLVNRLETDGGAPVHVIVGDGPNDALGRRIRVAPHEGRGLTTDEWFELLLSHELTHVLICDAWGLPPALFWEGLPVCLGDDYVRTRVLGRSYHVWCRALDELGKLRRLAPLLQASRYYAARADFRVDLVAGSFCGYMLHTRGAKAMREFVQAVAPPPAHEASWSVATRLQQHFGDRLPTLERQWSHWLRETIPRDAALVERLAARDFKVVPKRPHCDRCFWPVQAGRCTGCARSDVVVEIV